MMHHTWSRQRAFAALATAVIFAACAAVAYAVGSFYFTGGLSSVQAAPAFANHVQHYVIQVDNSQADAYLQTGHENASGAHVAIERGYRVANWGPSGPAGWYGKPKCWRLSGPNPATVKCFRDTA